MQRFLISKLVRLSAAIPLRRFENSLNALEEAQLETLSRILRSTQSTAFGRSHRCGTIDTVNLFQESVPIRSYESLRSYLNRVENGETDALLPPGEKLLMFGLTSGSTGEPKKIPVTTTYLKRFRETHRIWSSYCARDHPEIAGGGFFGLASNWKERYTESGVPCGAVTGLVREVQPPWIKRKLVLPISHSEIEDPEVRDAAALHHALSRKTTLLKAANPSSLLKFAQRLEREGETALRHLQDGAFPYRDQLPPSYRDHPDFRPQPKRARELSRRIEEAGRLSPKTVWPELGLLSCWMGGTLSPYLESLARYYDGIPIRDPGLLASEGRFTIPVEDNTASGLPDVDGLFFEFYPEDEGEVPVGKAAPLLGLHELEEGKRYYLIFTAPWGLFRYHIDDIVEVTGYWRKAPLLRFVRKGSGYANLTGEKLAEDQVVLALNRLPEEFAALRQGDSLLAPQWGDPPGYLFLVEKNENLSDALLTEGTIRLEQLLQDLNVEYASKRKSERLAPLQPAMLEPGTFDLLRQEEIAQAGGRADQYKLKRIRGDYEFLGRLGNYQFVGQPESSSKEVRASLTH